MLGKEEIAARLQRAGFTDDDITSIQRDISELILAKVAAKLFASLPENERNALLAGKPEDMQKYIDEHTSSLPPFSQSAFEKLHDEVWSEYLSAIE